MGKSYKKNPIIKSGGTYKKHRYNKVIRKGVKTALRKIEMSTDIENYEIPDRNELVNKWNVHDYEFYLDKSKPETKKYLRK